MSAARFYYLDEQGAQQGPVSPNELRDLCATGRVPPDRYIWTDGWSDWQPASTVPEFFGAAPQGAPAVVAESGPAAHDETSIQPQTNPSAQRVNAFGVPMAEDDTPEPRHMAPPTEAGPLGGGGGGFRNAGGAPRTPFGGPALMPTDYRPKSFTNLFAWWIGLGLVGALAYAGGFGLVMSKLFSAEMTHLSMEAQQAEMQRAMTQGGVLILAGVPFILMAAITWYRLLYRCWRQIQDGAAETTPGKAVGFLFIPFFNLYWHFVALWGLSKDMEQYALRHRVPGVGVSPGIGLTLAVTNVASFFAGFAGPFALLVPPVLLLTLLIFTWQIASGSRAIAAHQQGVALA